MVALVFLVRELHFPSSINCIHTNFKLSSQPDATSLKQISPPLLCVQSFWSAHLTPFCHESTLLDHLIYRTKYPPFSCCLFLNFWKIPPPWRLADVDLALALVIGRKIDLGAVNSSFDGSSSVSASLRWRVRGSCQEIADLLDTKLWKSFLGSDCPQTVSRALASSLRKRKKQKFRFSRLWRISSKTRRHTWWKEWTQNNASHTLHQTRWWVCALFGQNVKVCRTASSIWSSHTLHVFTKWSQSPLELSSSTRPEWADKNNLRCLDGKSGQSL